MNDQQLDSCDLCGGPLGDDTRQVQVHAQDKGETYKMWWNDYHPECYQRIIEHEQSLAAPPSHG